MKISSLLNYLKCPICKAPNLEQSSGGLVCLSCGGEFEVVENVPVLMKQEDLSIQEENQQKWFNEHYSTFSDEDYRLENWRQSMLNRIFDQPFKNKVRIYLDIGCGATGYTAIEGARRNNWTAIGTDISLEAMLRAQNLATKQGVGDKTAFVVCSAENLPFKCDSFDYISAISLLEHLGQDQKAIQGMCDALGEGGFIYICVPNTYLRIYPFLWPYYYYKDRQVGHLRHYGVDTLDKYFEDHNGLKKSGVIYNGHLIKLFQLFLERIGRIDDNKWWKLENKDINQNPSGVQLNVIYHKRGVSS